MKALKLFIVFFSLDLSAAWNENRTIYEIHTKNPDEIRMSLANFSDALAQLSAENLVTPSKVIAKEFSGRTVEYIWKNDDQCKVTDPGSLQPVSVSETLTTYVLEKDETINFLETAVVLMSPCHSKSAQHKVMVKRFRK